MFSKPHKIRDLEDVLREGRLTVFIESGVYGFTRDSVQVSGFQYEIIKAFADSLGVELVIINQENTKDITKLLAKNTCDILVSLKPIVTDSNATVVSTVPIITSRLVLAQHVDGEMVRMQYELDGDTLLIAETSAFKKQLDYLMDDLAIDIVVVEMSDVHTADLVQMVHEQKIKFTFCPEYLVNRFKVDYPDVNFSLALSFPFGLAWRVHPESPELHAKLNEFLLAYLDSQQFIELQKKYHNQ